MFDQNERKNTEKIIKQKNWLLQVFWRRFCMRSSHNRTIIHYTNTFLYLLSLPLSFSFSFTSVCLSVCMSVCLSVSVSSSICFMVFRRRVYSTHVEAEGPIRRSEEREREKKVWELSKRILQPLIAFNFSFSHSFVLSSLFFSL